MSLFPPPGKDGLLLPINTAVGISTGKNFLKHDSSSIIMWLTIIPYNILISTSSSMFPEYFKIVLKLICLNKNPNKVHTLHLDYVYCKSLLIYNSPFCAIYYLKELNYLSYRITGFGWLNDLHPLYFSVNWELDLEAWSIIGYFFCQQYFITFPYTSYCLASKEKYVLFAPPWVMERLISGFRSCQPDPSIIKFHI